MGGRGAKGASGGGAGGGGGARGGMQAGIHAGQRVTAHHAVWGDVTGTVNKVTHNGKFFTMSNATNSRGRSVPSSVAFHINDVR
jgi:hypothetical protein